MGTHSNANQTLTDVAEHLQDVMEKNEGKATVCIGKTKMNTFNEYALIFVQNLNYIIDIYNLSKTEIKVVLKIIEYMFFGNLISLANSTLAKDLNMDRSNVSKIMKKLKSTELIIEKDGSLYFNPHIACKGSLNEKITDDRLLLDYSAIILSEFNNGLTPSIGTPNIRKNIAANAEKTTEEIKKKVDEYYNKTNN